MEIDWKKFEQNNKSIALNSLFVPHNTKTIRLACKSKYNCKRKNKVVLLMITDGKKQHYLALKNELVFDGKKWHNYPIESLPKSFSGKTSNHTGNSYCLGCFHSYSTVNSLKKHERLCDKHDYCHVDIPTEYNKILKCNHGEKSLKAPFTIFIDLACLSKNCIHVKIIQKNLTQREKLNTSLEAGQWLRNVCLMQMKTNLTIIE